MKKFLTIDEVAANLKIAKNTIYGWIREEFIPYHKVGRLVRFDPDKIDEWMLSMSKKGRTTRKPRINLD
jgi:excisionase family DNA binding protein